MNSGIKVPVMTEVVLREGVRLLSSAAGNWQLQKHLVAVGCKLKDGVPSVCEEESHEQWVIINISLP